MKKWLDKYESKGEVKNSLNRKVTCSNCGWSWKLSDGGEDPLTCHKCGGTIKMKHGGELDEYQKKGEVKSTFNPYANVNRVSSSDGTRVFRLNPEQVENAKKAAAIRNEKIVKEYYQNQRSFIGPDKRTKAERDKSIAARKAYDELVEKQKVMSQQPIYQFLQNTTPGGYNPNAAYNPVIGNTAGVLGYTAAGALLSPVVRPAFNFMGQVMNAPILGVAGFTGNNIVNAGFATHGLKSIMDGSVAKPWREARKTGNPWDYVNAVNENLMTSLELFPLVGPGYRGALKTGEYLTTQTPLKNTFKINPLAEKLNSANKSYRIAGMDAAEDFQKTGFLRSNPTIVPANFAENFAGTRTTGFPSFQKGYADLRYLPEEGGVIFETSLPTFGRGDINPVTGNVIKGRHYAHRVIDPVTGKVVTNIPGKDIRMFEGKPHWLKGYPQIKVPKQSVDFSKYLTQEEAVAARANRLISQKNKPGWNEQLTPELEQRLSTAVERHNPASDYPGEKLGANTMGRTATEVSRHPMNADKLNPNSRTYDPNAVPIYLNDANKARVAAHETGHYYSNSFAEGEEWLSHFNLNKIKNYKTRVYLRGNHRTTNYANEIRERAAQLKDYIAQKNGIPLDQDFIITQPMLDDAIKNYVKDTGLDNAMSKMLGALKDKKGLLKTMNKYALGVIPAAIGVGALNQKKHGGIIEDDMGQWAHPGQVTRINSNEITMQGVPYPVTGVDNLGNTMVMQPGMNYTFPGQYVTEYPMMQQGGLVKYQKGEEVKFNPYANINRIGTSDNTRVFRLNSEKLENAKKHFEEIKKAKQKAKQYAVNQATKAKKFHTKWMQSPRYNEMLKNSAGVNAKNINNARWNNLKNIKVFYNPNQSKGGPGVGGASFSESGDIHIYPLGANDKVNNLGVHEFSHSIDRDQNNFSNRLIPVNDVNKMKKYANTEYYNELLFEDLMFRKFNIINPKRKNTLKTPQQLYYERRPKPFLYKAEPTETRARLNDIRQAGWETGIYDPFTQKVNKKIFDKLNKSKFDLETDDGWSPLHQLQGVYNDDQIIDLLNTVSYNNKVSLNPQMIDNNSDWEIIG